MTPKLQEKKARVEAEAAKAAADDATFAMIDPSEVDGMGAKSRMDSGVEFPLDLLPEPIRAYCYSGGESVGCDPAMIFVPMLAALAGAIGSSRTVRLKSDWDEPFVVWSCIVADSGSMKSPTLDLAVRPFEVIADRARARALAEADEDEDGEREGPTFIADDLTVEALGVLLERNPRGLLVKTDELSAWFSSFNQYRGKGGDVGRWLSLHRAGRIVVNRKTGSPKSICVSRAAVSLTGSIQPHTLKRVLTEEFIDSGLAARFLWTIPKSQPRRWTDYEVPKSLTARVREVFERLLAMQPERDDDGFLKPKDLTLSSAALERFKDFIGRNGQEAALLDPAMKASWPKLEGYAARIAGIFALVEQSTAAGDGEITLANMDAALNLIAWFKSETRRVFHGLRETPEDRARREALDLIQAEGGVVTERELQRRRPSLFKTPADAEAALNGLAKAGFGTWESAQPGPSGGRPTRRFRLTMTQ